MRLACCPFSPQYEEGEECGICGHRLAATEEKGPPSNAFPSEILPNFLYLGSYDNASRSELLKAMGIKYILNVRHPPSQAPRFPLRMRAVTCALTAHIVALPCLPPDGTWVSKPVQKLLCLPHCRRERPRLHGQLLQVHRSAPLSAHRPSCADVGRSPDLATHPQSSTTLPVPRDPDHVCHVSGHITHFTDTVRQENSKVLVHCMTGISRSPSLAIAYLMKLKGWRLVEAYQWTKARRIAININPGNSSLQTRTFPAPRCSVDLDPGPRGSKPLSDLCLTSV